MSKRKAAEKETNAEKYKKRHLVEVELGIVLSETGEFHTIHAEHLLGRASARGS